jgi:hypothetical protein
MNIFLNIFLGGVLCTLFSSSTLLAPHAGPFCLMEGMTVMSDYDDLELTYKPWLRWSSEFGVLGRSTISAEDERGMASLGLGTNDAKWAFDMSRRMRGYGKFRKGSREVALTPVGTPPPKWNGDKDWKPTLSIPCYHPQYGEHVFETSASNLMRVISNVWDQCKRYEEFYKGFEPVWFFVDRFERPEPSVDKIFWLPIIEIIAWIERLKLPFVNYPVTVPLLTARPSLEDMRAPSMTLITPRQSREPEVLPEPPKAPRSPKVIRAPKAPAEPIADVPDDEIPDLAGGDAFAVGPDPTVVDAAFAMVEAAGARWFGPKWCEDNGIAVETVTALIAIGRLVAHPIRAGHFGLPTMLATENGDGSAPASPKEPPSGERGKRFRDKFGKDTTGETPTS